MQLQKAKFIMMPQYAHDLSNQKSFQYTPRYLAKLNPNPCKSRLGKSMQTGE